MVIGQGDMVLHYWRFLTSKKLKDSRLVLSLVLTYQTEAHWGATAYSRGWSGPLIYCVAGDAQGGGGTFVTSGLRFSLWLLVIAFSSYPASVFVRSPLRRHRRRKRGLCLTCAYNLTGNTSGVCPECGTKIDPPG